MKAIIVVSESGLPLAEMIRKEWTNSQIYSKKEWEGCQVVTSYSDFLTEYWETLEAVVFI